MHVAVVEHHVRDLLGACAHERERGWHVIAQRLEGPQQHGQPLALDRLTDEQDPQRRRPVDSPARAADPRLPTGSIAVAPGIEMNAVWHYPIAPAEEASRRPGGGIRHRDAGAQMVHAAPPAERDRGDPVGQRVL